MKALGEAALELPWLSPCVASLTTLAGARLPAGWSELRCDPALALLVARFPPPSDHPLLETALQQLQVGGLGFVDWKQPGPDQVYRAALRQAQLASALASKLNSNPDRAWIGGMLAPLGWLAVCAVDPLRVRQQLQAPAWPAQAWGLDHAALARRLARRWQLPEWLVPLVGQLGLEADVAEQFDIDPVLFRIVQLAVRLYQQREPGLGLAVGTETGALLGALGLDAGEVEELTWHVLVTELPARTWEAPQRQSLLPELLRLALENRRLADGTLVAGLERDLDHMQVALERQCSEEKERLQALKLAALAEFAAGAGHEINNPLAVISGQAQYILKQLELVDGPADEIDDIGAYLEHLKTTVQPSLHKIIGQTQRIHGILTGLMQFARPAPPRLQPVQLGTLVREVVESLRELARERAVKLVCPEPDVGPTLEADPAQLRVALSCLLRNAIEAAPSEGWAGLRVEKSGPGAVAVVVEDSGQGPAPTVREHLFDPFFSGRSAGRGRGLGLPTAWRLARQQGGDVRLEAAPQGPTRFVMTLPVPAANGHHNGRHGKTAVGETAA